MYVDVKDPSVSTTMDIKCEVKNPKVWSIKQVYDSPFGVDELIKVLDVVDRFKQKYPCDDTFTNFEECVREEICEIFGGELPWDYED